VKKEEEEALDALAVSDDDSAEDKPAKNGKVENSEEDLEEDEHEVKEEVKGRRSGRGRPAAKTKEAAPKKPASEGKKRGRTTTPAPAKKSKKDESDEDPDKEYEVEKILEVRFRKGGKREFSIQWKGYGPKSATWEPEENLECEELLDSFMTKLGNVRPKVSKVKAK